MSRWHRLLALSIGFIPSTSHGQSAVWRIDPTPTVRLGTADGDTLTELVGITGVVALPNGATAVSLGRNRRVLFFDARGRLTVANGRRGAGPGEFSGSIATVRWSRDSVVVWDSGADRWSIFAANGAYGRQLSEVEARQNRRRGADVATGMIVWAYDARTGVPSWVTPLADSLRRGRAQPPAPTRARVDPQGFLWVRGLPDSTRWRIVAPSGAVVTTLTVPAGGDIVDISVDHVLLRTTDDDGFEFVQSHRLTRPAAAATLARATPAFAAAPSPAVTDTLRGWSRNLATAQEAGYADRMRYTTKSSELAYTLPPGYELVLYQADKFGWSGAVVHRASGRFCHMAVGRELTIGWDEGSPICTR